MAGSRLEKLGSIFSRTRGLLNSGVMPEAKKPLWYEVYAAFPPLRDPVYQDPNTEDDEERKEDPVRPILYPEDKIRAKFYQVYGGGPKAFELSKLNFKSVSQTFIEKYRMLEQQGEVAEDRLFEETGKALMALGILLRKQDMKKVPVAPPPPQEAQARDSALEGQPAPQPPNTDGNPASRTSP